MTKRFVCFCAGPKTGASRQSASALRAISEALQMHSSQAAPGAGYSS